MRWAALALSVLVPGPFGYGPPGDRGAQSGSVTGQVLFEVGPVEMGVVASDVIVYLATEGLDPDAQAQPGAPPARIHQFDYTFHPHVLPVRTGNTIVVTNGDDETHNIHTYSKGRRRNRTFNEAQRPGDTLEVTFPNPDSLRVLCDIHSQMLAHLLILPNPYFTMADAEGNFELTGVPPGEHRIVAWQEEYGAAEAIVEVIADEEAHVDLTFSGSGA